MGMQSEEYLSIRCGRARASLALLRDQELTAHLSRNYAFGIEQEGTELTEK
jgi:hypothetical protein